MVRFGEPPPETDESGTGSDSLASPAIAILGAFATTSPPISRFVEGLFHCLLIARANRRQPVVDGASPRRVLSRMIFRPHGNGGELIDPPRELFGPDPGTCPAYHHASPTRFLANRFARGIQRKARNMAEWRRLTDQQMSGA